MSRASIDTLNVRLAARLTTSTGSIARPCARRLEFHAILFNGPIISPSGVAVGVGTATVIDTKPNAIICCNVSEEKRKKRLQKV